MAQKQSNSPAVTMMVLSLISSRTAHVAHYSSAGSNTMNNDSRPQVLSEDDVQAWTERLNNFNSTSQHLVAESQTLANVNSEDKSTHLETQHTPKWRMGAARRRYKRDADSDDTFGIWTLPNYGRCWFSHDCHDSVDSPLKCYLSSHLCNGFTGCANARDELYCEDSLHPYTRHNDTVIDPAESSGITWPGTNLKGCARACNDMVDGCVAFVFSYVRNGNWRCLTYTRMKPKSRNSGTRFDTYVRNSPSKPRFLEPPPRNAPAMAPASQPTQPASSKLPTDCGQRPLAAQAVLDVATQSKVVQSSPSSNRVVSGFRASAGTYPWQMQIQAYDAGSWQHRCGGVLISSRHMLTAAHCVSSHILNALKVVVGQHSRMIVSEPHEQIFAIENMLIHPEYLSITGSANANDIALVKLRLRNGRSVQFSSHVQPLCLPPPGTTTPTHTECEISGWGKTDAQAPDGHSSTADTLHGGQVPLVSDSFCSSPEVYGTQYLPDRMVCAGDVRGGTDACQGDSGGPLACQREDGLWMATGIVSFGGVCGAAAKPGVYTEVSFYVDWIHQVVNVI